MRAARLDGGDSARVKRLRHAARELIMSVQPKGSPQQRKAFRTAGEGLYRVVSSDLIGWPIWLEGAAEAEPGPEVMA